MTDHENNYQQLIAPTDELARDMSRIEGDILLLGAGGKMGPALATLAKKACAKAGISKRIIAVSRFSDAAVQAELESCGVETFAADLLDDQQLESLPPVANVLYLAGTKFGTGKNESLTWAMNSYLPGRVAEKYRRSRIVAFSTGNIYHLTPVHTGGSTEDAALNPVGEYAQSCLGRERIFEYCCRKNNTPLLIYRLNYANDVSYGVLVDIATNVMDGKSIDVRTNNVNVIWQGDANEMAIRALLHCSVPPAILNIAGPETTSVQWIAQEFGKLFGKTPQFVHEPQPTALLSNAAEAFRLFGYPRVTLKQMILIIAQWIGGGGKIAYKDTHFQERHGQF